MSQITRNAAGKIVPHRFTLQELEEADDRQIGFCLACRAERESCEPDARKYGCEDCGTPTVYGAQEIGIMGLFKD